MNGEIFASIFVAPTFIGKLRMTKKKKKKLWKTRFHKCIVDLKSYFVEFILKFSSSPLSLVKDSANIAIRERRKNEILLFKLFIL